MQAPEVPRTSRRRNPVDASLYHNRYDPRDEPPKEREEEPRFPSYGLRPRERSAFGYPGACVGAVAAASADRPRWQKIIEHANSLADERGISREQFYAMALIEFIEKIENLRITEELNEAYENIDQQEETAFLNLLVRHYDPRLADE